MESGGGLECHYFFSHFVCLKTIHNHSLTAHEMQSREKNAALHLLELWWESVINNVPSLIMVVMITRCSSSTKPKCIGPFGINFKEDSIQELK